MADLSVEDVLKVARLSKLAVEPDAVERERERLASVLNYVERLGELDLDGVEPLAHVGDEVNRLAEDQPAAPIEGERAAALWPERFESGGVDGESDAERFIRVPKVLGDGGGA